MMPRGLVMLTLLLAVGGAFSHQDHELSLHVAGPKPTFRSLVQARSQSGRRELLLSSLLPGEGELYGPCSATACCSEGVCYGSLVEGFGEVMYCIMTEDAAIYLEEGYTVYPVECSKPAPGVAGDRYQDLWGSTRDHYRAGSDGYRQDNQMRYGRGYDVQQDRNSHYGQQDRVQQDNRAYDRGAWDRDNQYEQRDRYAHDSRGAPLEELSTPGSLAEHAKCGPGVGCCQATNRAGEALVCGYEHQWYSQCLTQRQCNSDPEKKKFNCKDVDVCGLKSGGTPTTPGPTPNPKASPKPSPRPGPTPTPGGSTPGSLAEHAKCGPGVGCCQATNRAGEALVCGYEHQWYSQCLTQRQCRDDPEKHKFNCKDVDVCGLKKKADWRQDEGGRFGDRSYDADRHPYHG